MAAISNLLLSLYWKKPGSHTLSSLASVFLGRGGMDDTIRINGIELGQILEKQGDAYVIRTRRGGIFMHVYFWLADMFPKEKSDDFDPTVFKQELREALDTPDGWRRLRVEEGVHRLEMKLLARLSSDGLATYLKQRRTRYRDLLGIDPLNEDILWRIIAKGGQTVGLPSALTEGLGEEIQDIVRKWINSLYVYEHGSQNRLAWWGRRGIGHALKHLDELEGLDVVNFLKEHIEIWVEKGFWSIRAPGHKKGKKDLLDHPKELIRIDKGLRADHSLHVETEDEDWQGAYELTLGDATGTTRLDDDVRAQIKFEEVATTLTRQERQILADVLFGDLSLKDLGEGDSRKYARVRQVASRMRRKVVSAVEKGEAPKKRRGRPEKR